MTTTATTPEPPDESFCSWCDERPRYRVPSPWIPGTTVPCCELHVRSWEIGDVELLDLETRPEHVDRDAEQYAWDSLSPVEQLEATDHPYRFPSTRVYP